MAPVHCTGKPIQALASPRPTPSQRSLFLIPTDPDTFLLYRTNFFDYTRITLQHIREGGRKAYPGASTAWRLATEPMRVDVYLQVLVMTASPSSTPTSRESRTQRKVQPDLTLGKEQTGEKQPSNEQPSYEHEPTTPKQDPISAAREWRDTLRSQAGYEEGFTAAPGKALKTFNVTSAVQLPYIVAELKAHEGSIRLDFPTSSPKNAEVTKEQQAIREFLQTHHNADLETLKAALTEFLGKSPSYTRLAAQSDFSTKFADAKSWVEANLVAETAHDSSRLKVTDIISAEEVTTRNEPDLLVSLEESARAGRETIITVPPAGEALDAVREKLHTLISNNTELQHAPISVWTNVKSTDLRDHPFMVKSIKQQSLAEFLAGTPANKADPLGTPQPAAPKSRDEGSKPEPHPNTSSAESDIVVHSEPGTESLLEREEVPHSQPNSETIETSDHEQHTDPSSQHPTPIILTNSDAPVEPRSETTPENVRRKLTHEEIHQDRIARLDAGKRTIESLEALRALALKVERLDRGVTQAQARCDTALTRVKLLLQSSEQEQPPDSEAIKGKKPKRHGNQEIDRARNHDSTEGRDFKAAVFVVNGMRDKLMTARKKLRSSCKQSGLDPLLTPQGEKVPLLTTQSIEKALRKENNRVRKLAQKIAQAANPRHGSGKEAVKGGNDPVSKAVNKQSQEIARLERANAKARTRIEKALEQAQAQLKDRREQLDRAVNIEGRWKEWFDPIVARGERIHEAQKDLTRLKELVDLQRKDRAGGPQYDQEIESIYKKHKIRKIHDFENLLFKRKAEVDQEAEEFTQSHNAKKDALSSVISELELEIQSLQERLAALTKPAEQELEQSTANDEEVSSPTARLSTEAQVELHRFTQVADYDSNSNLHIELEVTNPYAAAELENAGLIKVSTNTSNVTVMFPTELGLEQIRAFMMAVG
jgi:hypothetical protein